MKRKKNRNGAKRISRQLDSKVASQLTIYLSELFDRSINLQMCNHGINTTIGAVVIDCGAGYSFNVLDGGDSEVLGGIEADLRDQILVG